MRHYECECLRCSTRKQIAFSSEPYPELGEVFSFECTICKERTNFTRVIGKKASAELCRKHAEQKLRQTISDGCAAHGFQHRFLYQSVIITTQLSDWCFDYHQSAITLYHESSVKINFQTGDYAKSHVQFRNRKMSPLEVIEYIAAHDAWRAIVMKDDSGIPAEQIGRQKEE
ncbi:MAG: hypothetical protein PUK18_06105 [Firmicutes bacterium]|nr:hypothetical protein [Bacillota bacterium]MDY6160765.1 hypothetical protein [Candidatus Faecousia sp.]